MVKTCGCLSNLISATCKKQLHSIEQRIIILFFTHKSVQTTVISWSLTKTVTTQGWNCVMNNYNRKNICTTSDPLEDNRSLTINDISLKAGINCQSIRLWARVNLKTAAKISSIYLRRASFPMLLYLQVVNNFLSIKKVLKITHLYRK